MEISRYTEQIDRSILIDTSLADSRLRLIAEAANYSVSCGGKRIRPVLCLMFCEACGGRAETAIPLARAVEYIHTYSLIHDDLPCMDNDDYRRGKPSCHKQYGEANALLAGDALLTLAFETVADGARAGVYSHSAAVEAISVLSSCAGWEGMIGGQSVDLQSEGKHVSVGDLELMDKLKTGKLIEAACVMGCIAAGASQEKRTAAAEFAQGVGMAFQITDDILDVTGTAEQLGKNPGSDAQNDKSTYVSHFGIEECRRLAEEYTENALKALEVFEEDTTELKKLASELCGRNN